VEIRITPDVAQFVVGDEGPGFDVKEMISKARQMALSGGAGRGLFLMWAFMDSLTFDENGNTMVMIKRRSSPSSLESVAGTKKAELPKVMGIDPHDRSSPVSLTSGELRAVIKRMAQLTSESGLRNINQQELIDLLKVFRDQLAQRFDAFGYFEEAVKSAPNGGRQSQRLRDQHKELYQRAQRVAETATNGADDFVSLSLQVQELLRDLEVYEAAETEIIVNAMFQDIGGGD
jgi:Histidine kinase-like ATPase domain